MLRHQGKNRTAKHNLRLAIALSFVAGVVNICGVLHVGTLTTNVTGHFAFFAEQLVNRNYAEALVFMGYIISFLAGSFTSSLMSEVIRVKKPGFSHIAPMFVEFAILLFVGAGLIAPASTGILAAVLLFSMGLQNSLVTTVSSSVVRTTHLTGLFTDLGIEISQLIFYRNPADRHKLRTSLLLRITIIISFFSGCVLGGFTYFATGLNALNFAACILLGIMIYDNAKYRMYFLRRKIREKLNTRV